MMQSLQIFFIKLAIEQQAYLVPVRQMTIFK